MADGAKVRTVAEVMTKDVLTAPLRTPWPRRRPG